MKEKFESILNARGIYGEDVEEVLYAVHDMLLFAADKMNREEPYAVNDIMDIEKSAYYVYSLVSEL